MTYFLYAIKIIMCVLICLLPGGIARAQQEHGQSIVKGTILYKNQPAKGIAISLRRLHDTSEVKKTLTDSSGAFIINNLVQGKYFINIQTDTTISIEVNGDKDTIILPVVIIEGMNKQTLKGVEVTGKKALFEKKTDRLVYNVKNSIAAQTGTLWEQILHMPGVRNDASNNLLYSGQSVKVLINDKLQPLSGQDLAEYLKSIPALNADKLELITTPPSKYDADGFVLINVIMQKRDKGVYGSIQSTYEQGNKARLRNSIDLNMQGSKVGLYGRYTLSSNNNPVRGNEETYYSKGNNVTSAWIGNYHNNSKSDRNSYQAILDYYINKKSVLSVELNGLFAYAHNENNSTNVISHESIVDSMIISKGNTGSPSRNFMVNINYNIKLDTLGKKLFIYGDYTNYYKRPEQSVTGKTSDQYNKPIGNDILYNINTKQKVLLTSISVDYIMPLKGTFILETGAKYVHSEIDNRLDYFSSHNFADADTTKSNQFIYKEQNYAAYASINGTWKKTDLKLGVRAENTYTRGISPTSGIINRNNYIKLFPTFTAGRTFGGKHYVDLAYNRRISRPEYFRLNPFRYYANPYQIYVGNPFLLPSITSRIAAGYTYDNNLYITFYYSEVKNSFQQLTYQDNTNSTLIYTHVNFGEKKEFGFYSGFNKVIKIWETNVYAQLAHQQHKTLYLDQVLNNQSWRTTLSWDNTVRISKKYNINAQLNGWYVSPGVQGIFKVGGTGAVDLLVSKQFSKWNVSVGVNDILYSQPNWLNVNYLTQQLKFIEYGDSRQLRFAISYKFGKKGNNVKKVIRKTSADPEIERI